jgi:hypothetical protein
MNTLPTPLPTSAPAAPRKSLDADLGQIWLPMPGENERWYQRFSQYLAMGARRSIRGVYNAEKGNEHSKAVPASWSRATKRFEWQRRAKAYDDWRRQEVFTQGNAQDTERVKMLDELINKLHERTIKMLTKMQDDVTFNEKLVAQLLSALDLMAKHTGGYAPQRHEITGKDGGTIEIHEEQEQTMRVVFYTPEIAPLPDVVDADPPVLSPGDEQS